ncbi:meiotic recombination protein REC114 [Bombina bombina]|uniref:meiotic recombination protein REC114 n=1 Tax=Bombina bombina TaxID=8345 RepID=UPI00235A6B5F|nr:meiotic recombination protein REC114 [Bombina bombina]
MAVQGRESVSKSLQREMHEEEWPLKRYGRLRDGEREGEEWKIFESNDQSGRLTLTIVNTGHFFISQGHTLLEGFSLISAETWLKVGRKSDCILFGSKNQQESRMFRVQFNGETKEEAVKSCDMCVQKLQLYVPVQVSKHLCYKVKRNNTDEDRARAQREEMRERFLRRGYQNRLLEQHITEINSQETTDKRGDRGTEAEKMTLVTTYAADKNGLNTILKENWKILSLEDNLPFKTMEKPRIGYRRGKSLKDILSSVIQRQEDPRLPMTLLLRGNTSTTPTIHLSRILSSSSPQTELRPQEQTGGLSLLTPCEDVGTIYQHSILSTDELGSFLRLCLLDQHFPAFVEAVEKELQKLTES